MDAEQIAELIAKELGQQPDPPGAITKFVAELADVAVKEAEQSDAWLLEFDRLLGEMNAGAWLIIDREEQQRFVTAYGDLFDHARKRVKS